ncbi:hypothetical protein [Dyella sp.]|uniref:hypothetical protein n=1 Tax=Dyella sp. TaxID=1869338 RepID=UPI002ED21ADE
MLAQYVYSAKTGLFRIVQHGRRWRSLCGEQEVGRHETLEAAIAALRGNHPQARLPEDIESWRHLPALALLHSRPANEPVMRWQVAV